MIFSIFVFYLFSKQIQLFFQCVYIYICFNALYKHLFSLIFRCDDDKNAVLRMFGWCYLQNNQISAIDMHIKMTTSRRSVTQTSQNIDLLHLNAPQNFDSKPFRMNKLIVLRKGGYDVVLLFFVSSVDLIDDSKQKIIFCVE